MLKETDIYKCIEEMNICHFRLFDMNNNKMYEYNTGTSSEDAKQHLMQVLPMFKGYGKIKVQCATEAQKKSNWKNSSWLICAFDGTGSMQQNISGPQWNVPAGYMHQDLLIAKIDAMQKENAWNFEKFKLLQEMKENQEKDPLKQLDKIAPYALYMMGKPLDEIGRVTQALRIGNANLGRSSGSGSIAAVGTLTFKDVDKLPEEEKQKKFQELADSVAKKVSIEEMTVLYDAINNDPTLVKTAIEALPLLKK